MRRRRALGGAVGLLAVLLLVVALGYFPQEPLRRLAERRLREALGPQAHIGHLHVVPGRLRAELRDLLIETPDYRIEMTIASRFRASRPRSRPACCSAARCPSARCRPTAGA